MRLRHLLMMMLSLKQLCIIALANRIAKGRWPNLKLRDTLERIEGSLVEDYYYHLHLCANDHFFFGTVHSMYTKKSANFLNIEMWQWRSYCCRCWEKRKEIEKRVNKRGFYQSLIKR